MKTSLAVLFAVLVLLIPARGHSSPAASASETKAAAASSLTSAERKKAIDYLEETRKNFLAATEGLSDAQWKFKPGPDRWSIAEVSEHIALAEGRIWSVVNEKVMKSPAAPEKKAEVKGKDEIILEKVPARTKKAQAPEQLKPTGKWGTRAELVKDFEATRDKEIAYLKETKDDLRSHFGEHPALKTLDAYQWLLFNGAHSQRHTAQIEEVKADPNYPKG